MARSNWPAQTWSPASLGSKLTTWFDAQDPLTLIFNSGNVASWANKGSAGGSADQASASLQPIYRSRGLNGLPCLGCVSNRRLVTTFSLDYTVSSCAMVFVIDGNTASSKGIYGSPNGSLFYRVNGTTLLLLAHIPGVGGDMASTTPCVVGVPVLYQFDYDDVANAAAVWRNGVADGAVASALTGASAQVAVGNNVAGTMTLNGAVGEIVATNEVLNSADRQLLTSYLLAKWNLS